MIESCLERTAVSERERTATVPILLWAQTAVDDGRAQRLTDEELVARCRSGRSEEFAPLVQRYEKPLFAFLFRRLGNRELALEGAQEALVRAWFGLGRLENPGAFHSWLIGIGARVAFELRRRAQRPTADPEVLAELPAPVADEPPDCGIDEAIAALPEAQRRVVLLRYYDELSCQQIAERLATPLGTVTKTLSRAYAALRERLHGARTDGMEVGP